MIRKTMLLLCFMLLAFLFFKPMNSTMISVFRLTDSPAIVTKGHYGTSLVVEISFSDEHLLEWLTALKEPYPLLLLDADWIERSPKHVEVILKKKLPSGLLGSSTSEEESLNVDLLNKEIAIYKKHFSSEPLWFTTHNHQYSQSLQKTLFDKQINILSPSIIWQGNKTEPSLQKGDFLFVSLHEDHKISFNKLNTLLQKNNFMSIEENIFGYTIQSKKSP